jgi:hypothetical protein
VDLKPLLVHNHLLDEHHVALFTICSDLKTEFPDLRESKRREMAFLKTISGERPGTNIGVDEELDVEEEPVAITKELEGETGLEVQASSIRWRINFQNATITKI